MLQLTRQQKEAVGLLSIGTILEYFDLMLYVHMAVLLNELFFPKTDIQIKSLITAAAFCSTYLMRPFGALLFGYIGDNIGRKYTLVITTLLMSLCCLTMTVLPTYAEIGIAASIAITVCRMVQGMSSLGEIVGAQLYLTELIKPPARYQAVAIIPLAASVGAFGSLGIASLVLSNPSLSWRYAFGIGAFIATIGWFARSVLRETPEFSDARKRHKNILMKTDSEAPSKVYNWLSTIKAQYKTTLSLFALDAMWPLCFYFGYIYCGEVLQNVFAYTSTDIVRNNFIVSIFQVGMDVAFVALCRTIHPLKILQVKAFIVGGLFFIFPFLANWATAGYHILIFQCILAFFVPNANNSAASLYVHFPVLQRFRYSSLLYALSRAIVYVATSFGSIFLFQWFGHWGVSTVAILMVLMFLLGGGHFIALEKSLGHAYPWVRH